MMLIDKLSSYKESVIKNEYSKKEELEFLNQFNLDYISIAKLDNDLIMKILYIVFTDTEYKNVISSIDTIKDVFNKLSPLDEVEIYNLFKMFELIIEKDIFHQLYKFYDNYEDNLNKFNNINMPEELRKYFDKLFLDKKNNKFDFEKYNVFLLFCKNNNRLELIRRLRDFMDIRIHIEDIYDLTNDNQLSEEYKKFKEAYKELFKVVEDINKYRNNLVTNKDKYNKNKNKISSIIDKIVSDINSNKEIDINLVSKYIDDNDIINDLVKYNIELLKKEMNNEKKKYEELKSYELDSNEKLLSEYNIDIKTYKIKKSVDSLVMKLGLISKHFKKIKEYPNVLIKLINDVDFTLLSRLIYFINNSIINENMILDLVDILDNEEELSNYIKNIDLLNEYVDVKDVYKYTEEVLFIPNEKLKNIINKYREYAIDLSGECYDYRYLLDDYSYIIDKFIEIGEYGLIKNNPSLITDESNIIVKRCIIYKSLNNKCVNDENKLRGSLRNERNFILTDIETNDTIKENYRDIIDDSILYLLDERKVDNIELNLDYLDKFKVDSYTYKFGNMLISKNKLINNLKKIYNGDIVIRYSESELLINAILYNYPNTIKKSDLDYLHTLFDNEKKLVLN